MPPALACKFTVGELAVLRIVSDEVCSHGFCNLTIPEIAARAGVGQTKARMALKEAARLGLATVEERRVPYRPNLPNVVRIISREWLAWIARAGLAGAGEDRRAVTHELIAADRGHAVRDALIAFMVATAQAQAEAAKEVLSGLAPTWIESAAEQLEPPRGAHSMTPRSKSRGKAPSFRKTWAAACARGARVTSPENDHLPL